MPNLAPRRLPLSQPPHGFNVLVDFTDIFGVYYAAMATYAPSEDSPDECFGERAAGMICDDIISMGVQALGDVIRRGTQHLGTGVSYSAVAQLTKQVTVRECLWPEHRMDLVYRPNPTPTEQYHLDLLEDSASSAIAAMFSGCNRVESDAFVDAAVWRAVIAMTLEIAQAIECAGRAMAISEYALMSYEIDHAFPAKDRAGRVGDAYIYVIALRGP